MTGRLGWGPRASAASTRVTSRSSPARAASPASSSWPCGAPCGPTAPSATQSTSTPSILYQETLVEVTENIGKNWPQGHALMISVPILNLDPQLITWNFTIGSENHDNTRYNDHPLDIFKTFYKDPFSWRVCLVATRWLWVTEVRILATTRTNRDSRNHLKNLLSVPWIRAWYH